MDKLLHEKEFVGEKSWTCVFNLFCIFLFASVSSFYSLYYSFDGFILYENLIMNKTWIKGHYVNVMNTTSKKNIPLKINGEAKQM